MTRSDAQELADFIGGLADCYSVDVKINRRGGGYALVVRMVDTPPRTYTRHAAAFSAYCGIPDDEG